MDVEGEEKDESIKSIAQNVRRRLMTKTSMEESRVDDEGEEGNEFRSSTAPNARRKIVTKTPLEENKSDARTVAVTTQESLDGIREKAMRIASLDEMEAKSSARTGPSPGGAEIDKTKQAKEIVSEGPCGFNNETKDIVVACCSKSKLWKDLSLKQATHN